MDLWQFLTQGLDNRQIQGVVTMSWRAALVFHVAWVCGFLGPLGFAAPFARANDVSKLQTDVTKLISGLELDRIDRLEAEVYATRRLQCTAIKEGTSDQQRLYSDRLNELVLKYRGLTNAYPRIPSCDEV